MDWVKEIFDTANSKIRSPVLGSIVFAFCAVNWKVLFYLAFSNVTVVQKFDYFDKNTNHWSLLVIPILAGLSISWLNPWIKLATLRITQKPIQNVKIMQLVLANERLIKKQHLEKSRRDIVASVEEDLIAKAKRDQEILQIENHELREELKNIISELRKSEAEAKTKAKTKKDVSRDEFLQKRLDALIEEIKIDNNLREM